MSSFHVSFNQKFSLKCIFCSSFRRISCDNPRQRHQEDRSGEKEAAGKDRRLKIEDQGSQAKDQRSTSCIQEGGAPPTNDIIDMFLDAEADVNEVDFGADGQASDL